MAIGTEVLGAMTCNGSPQSLNLAEIERGLPPVAVVVPATRIGSASPIVAT